MVKHALIHLTVDWEKLLSFPLDEINYPQLNEMVFRSIGIKRAIVDKDPYEKNIQSTQLGSHHSPRFWKLRYKPRYTGATRLRGIVSILKKRFDAP